MTLCLDRTCKLEKAIRSNLEGLGYGGYERLGKAIGYTLKGHMRAAIRRRILAANGQTVWADTQAMDAYKRGELVGVLKSVMRKGAEYPRKEVIESVARYLGFSRARDTVKGPIKSAINAAIRRGVLGGDQKVVWREE